MSRVAAVCGLLAALLLAGCFGSGRSEEAFCDSLHAHNESLGQRSNAAGKDLGSQFQLILQNAGEVKEMLGDLSDHAPEEIRADAETVNETISDAIDKATDQSSGSLSSAWFGALTGGIGAASRVLMNSDSFARVERYATTHCGMGLFTGPTG